MLLKQIKNLNTQFLEKQGIRVNVLEELNSIGRRAVYHWIDQYQEQLEELCGDIRQLQCQVKALYEKRKRKTIPMDDLVLELEKIINPNQ
ncbi:hypothetical protein BGP_3894 [Beggiatoa sp. PS]|nr:hypothetical protein BGP_3894 [Beggiatoa sp. PS]